MNTIMRSLAAANGVRVRLGSGEPGLYPLLGGWGAGEEDGASTTGGGASGAYSRIARLRADVRVGGGSSTTGGGGGAGGSKPGCVDADSWLPVGIRARDVRPGMLLQVVNPDTLERGWGQVTYSETKQQLRYRVACERGVQLVCSDTAPIPTDKGLLPPMLLFARQVVVEIDGELARVRVVDVKRLDVGEVQHITCGNQCFLAGEHAGFYLLHHNIKNNDEPGEPGYQGP